MCCAKSRASESSIRPSLTTIERMSTRANGRESALCVMPMIYDNAAQAASAIAARVGSTRRTLILTHINPDGDAIGSLLGMWHALQAMGKEAIPLASSEPPSYTFWLPGGEHLRVYQIGTQFPEADLIIMVDVAAMPRVGQIFADHANELMNLPLIVVDHHVTNDGP